MSGGGWLTTYEARKERFDLATALDPRGYARQDFENGEKKNSLPGDKAGKVLDSAERSQLPAIVTWSDLSPGQRIDLAFDAFYDPAYGAASGVAGQFNPNSMRFRRDRIQEELLGLSNARCALFKSLLYELRAKTNTILGTIATATGVIGGIVTGAGASRALAGTSGIFSGTQAVVNQEMFQNLATQVIIEGIDVRRREVYDQIVQRGQALDIQEYPVEAAVKDAIFYHSQCNVVTGFQMAQDSIKTYADPGINAANRVLVKLKATRGLLQNQNLSAEDAMKMLAESESVMGLAGKPAETAKKQVLPVQALLDARSQILSMIAGYTAVASVNASEQTKATIDGAAVEARKNALDSLTACQQAAVVLSANAFEARAKESLPAPDEKEAAKLRQEKQKAEYEAGILVEDIRTVVALVRANVNEATSLVDRSTSETLNAAVNSGSVMLKRSVSAGECS